MIGKQVLAFGKSEKSEFINIGIFAASSGGRKRRRHIRRFTPDWKRSHVWSQLLRVVQLLWNHNQLPARTNIWAATWQNQQNHMCAQQTQISLSLRCLDWRNIGSLAHSEDTDQTGWIWVFAGRTGDFVGFVMRWLSANWWQLLHNKGLCQCTG